MADHASESTPLLTNFSPNTKPEDIIEPYLKSLTWSQILQSILTSLSSLFMAQQTFVSVFTDAKPTWHCTNPGDVTCDTSYDFCQLPSDAWSWDKPAYTSTISEWFLQCAGNSIIAGLPASSFFVGCLFGGILLFFIGDSFGRKKMLMLSCLAMSLASFFNAFSNNVWIYSALRFISGIGRAVTGSCGLVLAKEIVGKESQGKMETIYFLNFALGFMLLPVMSYYTQNYSWRVLYLLISIPAIVYCILLHFFAYESPRWLLAQDRSHEAVAILRSIVSSDAKNLNWNFDTGMITSNKDDQKLKSNRMLSFFKVLMEKKEILRQLLLSMIVGSGIGIVYYGMALGVNSLDFDLYWNVLLNASIQIPSLLVFVFAVSKWKRRNSLLGLSIIAGVCSILLCFMVGNWKDMQVVLELVSAFCSYIAFVLLLIYTGELFPTYIRNSAVAMVWLALMLGGAISPVMIAAGGNNKILSYGVFGVVIIVTGSLVIFLPETLGSMTCDDSGNEAGKRGNNV